MPANRLDAVLRVAVSFARQDPRPDAELLTCFLEQRDQAAFEALLARHTPAVRAACRGWLRSSADVDDAAQATFLVMVQRAATLRNRAALGVWLCRVAVNVARRLGRQKASLPLPPDVAGQDLPAPDDTGDLLAEEVARLPEKYRLPVQLCYSAGLTATEAARYLGWPRGTVLTRLAWARKRLRQSLARRGVSSPGFAALAGSAINRSWLAATARAALNVLAGVSPVDAGVSQRTIALTQGVVRAMTWKRLEYLALATLLALGVVGFGIHWAFAGPGKDPGGHDARLAQKAPRERDREAAADAPGKALDRPGRRREAVIRLPSGAFVKEVEAKPYGSGRLTWTYEDERVLGLIEGSVMGVEFELATEAEYSLSSNGTIYGLLTSVRLNHLRWPDTGDFKELQPFTGLWPAAEPLVTETLIDLPFSYRFRVHGDRLVISNFRMLLAGPNPLGKAGGMMAGAPGMVVTAFQVLGTAFEGTYLADDGREKRTPLRGRPPLKRGK